MRLFRDFGDRQTPQVDLVRLRQTFADQAKRELQLDQVIAELVRDQPGNAEAVAAAGIAARASIAHSASMIELGAAAVDALQRAGYLDRARHAPGRVPLPHSLTPPSIEAQSVDPIPDDWAE